MRIASVKLENIRSYVTEKIEFDNGITLLAGDIGSGKSTLLMAIEFALFGLERGAGASLLRHGEDKGSVEVSFETDKIYSVKRALKRTKQSIVQEAGWLETDVQREALTPSELRAKIFEILGYPLQYLNKKNVLYRFTLYTPQEEMKSILAGDDRVETIRRIFGIDAYQTISENSQLVARSLRERSSQNKLLVERMNTEIERLLTAVSKEEELLKQKQVLEKEKEKNEIERYEKELQEKEKELGEQNSRLSEIAIHKRNKEVLEQELVKIRSGLEQKERLVKTTEETLVSMNSKLTGEIDATIEEQLKNSQEELEQLRTNEGKIIALIEGCNHAPEEGTCPVCKQEVTETYRDAVHTTLVAKKSAAEKKKAVIKDKTELVRKTIDVLRVKLQRQQERVQLEKRKEEQEEALLIHKKEFAVMNESILEKEKILKEIPVTVVDTKVRDAFEEKVQEIKLRLKKERDNLMNVEKRLSEIKKDLDFCKEMKEQKVILENELKEKTKKSGEDVEARNWLLEKFTPFVGTLERHVLMAVHTTFDSAFRVWFGKLVEDDALIGRIDQLFTPILQQDGYDVDVQNLSGGERTAVSLAYRLSLVHTIHTLLPHLGTSGVIMLDEPTDGFSSEQLARVQEVLRELQMEQVILVSHEEQLEGFVDHILRVEKHGVSHVNKSL